MSRYDFLRTKVKEIQQYLNGFTILNQIFSSEYFKSVEAQINAAEKDGLSGPINSIFLLFVDDSQNGYQQAQKLEEYLELIFNHPTTDKGNKNHIIAQFRGSGSTDTLFEVSILGNLLKQLPESEIELFPKTNNNRDVEAKVKLVDRWVYIDVTVLNDSKEDTEIIERMLDPRIEESGGRWIDSDKDAARYAGKAIYKSDQFIPNTPNVLMISLFGTRLFMPGTDDKLKRYDILNLGAVFEFDRKTLNSVITENCDPNCSLSGEEIIKLKHLLSNESFAPLVYGV